MSDDAPALPQLPNHIVDAAIDWCVKLDYNRAGSEARKAFESWLAADALHALAWQRVRSIQHRFDSLPPGLTRATLDAAAARRLKGRRNALKLLAGAGICATGSLYALREYDSWRHALAHSETAVGEQQLLQLSDGTTLQLNTDSAVGVDLDGNRRIITLKRGEIRIETGKDTAAGARPFWVHTRFGTLQALGTRFVVRMEDGRVRVSVQEGAVQMHPARTSTSDSNAPIARANESFWLSTTAAIRAESRGISDDAWTDGVIAARDARLADVVAELARYRHGYVTCDDVIAERRISGIFHIGDTDQALQFLARTQSLELSHYSRFWVRLRAVEK